MLGTYQTELEQHQLMLVMAQAVTSHTMHGLSLDRAVLAGVLW